MGKKNKKKDLIAEVAMMERETDDRVLGAMSSSRRRLPIGMLAAAVAVWGVATEHWLWAAVVAVLLEVVNLLPVHGQLKFATYRRAWFVTIFFLWGLGISSWLENIPMEAVGHVLTWAPLTLLPLVLTGLIGKRPGVPLTVFPYLFRSRLQRYRSNGVPYASPRFSPHVPFVATLLLGASYGWNENISRWYFLALATVLVVWVWVDEAGEIRDVGLPSLKRMRALKLLFSLSILGVFAASASEGIHRLHQWVEDGGLSGRSSAGGVSGNRSSVSLGEIGRIQLDRSVIWRVKTQSGVAPDRLTDGVYDELTLSNVWLNKAQRDFEPLGGGKVDVAQDSWPLVQTGAGGDDLKNEVWRFELFGPTQDELTVLPLPAGAQAASNLPAFEVQRNGYGVVRVNSATSVLRPSILSVHGGALSGAVAPPDRSIDLNLQQQFFEHFVRLADELELHGKPVEEVTLRVEAFFRDGFEYSLDQRPERLVKFVQDERVGHCELFASATVLLFRAAGVPARYHTGFMISEFDQGSSYYNLRGSHAHAWAEVWDGEQWRVVDTTPSGWLDQLSGGPSWGQEISDQFSLWMMKFRHWRSNLETGGWAGSLLPWAIVIVVAYTVLRVWLGRREMFGKRRQKNDGRLDALEELVGEPTAWSVVRPEIEQRFGAIPQGTTPLRWVTSVNGLAIDLRALLERIVRSHYRVRFGGGSERSDELKGELEKCLASVSPVEE